MKLKPQQYVTMSLKVEKIDVVREKRAVQGSTPWAGISLAVSESETAVGEKHIYLRHTLKSANGRT